MPVRSSAADEYIARLPEERQAAISAVREVILQNLPEGFEEGIQYGMIGYYVPHSIYPAGYHCDPKQPLGFGALSSKKSCMTLHLMTLYYDQEMFRWFEEAYRATGKKLDMGKGCIRFKKLEDLPMDVIGQAIARVSCSDYVARCDAALSARRRK